MTDKAFLDYQLPDISTAAMDGDNLAIILCDTFDDVRAPVDDEPGWTRAAVAGCDEAIRKHYQPLADEVDRLRAELAAIRKPPGRPKYNVGDLVTVSPEYEFGEDWKRYTLKIVGVQLNLDKDRIEYTTMDPASPRDGLTDGWRETDLEPAQAAPTPDGVPTQVETPRAP